MSDDWQGAERRARPELWEVGLARVEGKLDAIIASTTSLSASVTAMDQRIRSLEAEMASSRQQLSDIERRQPPRISWTAATSAIVAIIALGLVLAEAIYRR